ncbi:MAG: hypothetical protein AABZ57_07390, partial [Candidatus Margulisiibacteriota bacterium]
ELKARIGIEAGRADRAFEKDEKLLNEILTKLKGYNSTYHQAVKDNTIDTDQYIEANLVFAQCTAMLKLWKASRTEKLEKEIINSFETIIKPIGTVAKSSISDKELKQVAAISTSMNNADLVFKPYIINADIDKLNISQNTKEFLRHSLLTFPPLLRARAMNALADAQLTFGNIGASKELSKQVVEMAKSKPAEATVSDKASALNRMGIISIGDSDFELAVHYFKLSESAYENDPKTKIYKGRAMFLTEKFGTDKFMKEYNAALSLIWKEIKPEDKPEIKNFSLDAIINLIPSDNKEASEAYKKLESTAEGRFLILVALEAASKRCFGSDLALSAKYLEKAVDLLKKWKNDNLSITCDYLYEAQLHYDLASCYTAWPQHTRFYDAYQEYKQVEKLGAPNWWIKQQLNILNPEKLGITSASNYDYAVFFTKYLENGDMRLDLSKDGVSGNAFIFTNKEKTAGVRVRLGLLSQGRVDAAIGVSKAKGSVTTDLGAHFSKDGVGDQIIGFDGEVKKRMSRFLTVGLKGKYDIHNGDYKFSAYEIEAYANYAKRIGKGLTFFSNLSLIYGSQGQNTWTTTISKPKAKEGEWAWPSDTVSITSNTVDGTKIRERYWIKYTTKNPVTDSLATAWHVATAVDNESRSIKIPTNNPDSPAEIVEINLINTRQAGYAKKVGSSTVFFDSRNVQFTSTLPTERPDPNLIDVYIINGDPDRPAIYGHEEDYSVEYVPGESIKETVVTVKGRNRAKTADGVWPTEENTKWEDWKELYKIRTKHTKTANGSPELELIFSQTGKPDETIYKGASTRDGSVAMEQYLKARFKIGIKRELNGADIKLSAYVEGAKYFGENGPNHTVSGPYLKIGADLSLTKYLSNGDSLTGALDLNNIDGKNWTLGLTHNLGTGRGLNLGFGSLGMSGAFNMKDWTVGAYHSEGYVGYEINDKTSLIYSRSGPGISYKDGSQLAVGITTGGGIAVNAGPLSITRTGVGFSPISTLFSAGITAWDIYKVRKHRHDIEKALKEDGTEQNLDKRAYLRFRLDEANIAEGRITSSVAPDLAIIPGILLLFGSRENEVKKAINTNSGKLAKASDKLVKDPESPIAKLALEVVNKLKGDIIYLIYGAMSQNQGTTAVVRAELGKLLSILPKDLKDYVADYMKKNQTGLEKMKNNRVKIELSPKDNKENTVYMSAEQFIALSLNNEFDSQLAIEKKAVDAFSKIKLDLARIALLKTKMAKTSEAIKNLKGNGIEKEIAKLESELADYVKQMGDPSTIINAKTEKTHENATYENSVYLMLYAVNGVDPAEALKISEFLSSLPQDIKDKALDFYKNRLPGNLRSDNSIKVEYKKGETLLAKTFSASDFITLSLSCKLKEAIEPKTQVKPQPKKKPAPPPAMPQ